MLNFFLFQEEIIPIVIFGFAAIIGLVVFGVWLWSLIDVIRSDFRGENDKLIWVLVVILGGILGSIIYFIVGRKNKV